MKRGFVLLLIDFINQVAVAAPSEGLRKFRIMVLENGDFFLVFIHPDVERKFGPITLFWFDRNWSIPSQTLGKVITNR